MVFMLLDPRRKQSGTTLENVAEDVLNGLFCHYEPPTSEYAQHNAAKEVRANPRKYSHAKIWKNKSILRTSKLFRKKHAPQTPKRGVTWRDEQARQGIEGRVVACATDQCDILHPFTKDVSGLADAQSPTMAHSSPPKNPFPEPPPIVETIPTMKDDERDDVAPKKVLYDDEGNPIDVQDENSTPETGTAFGASSYQCAPVGASNTNQAKAPPAPTGLSQLRKLARELDGEEDMYEPENYDQPKASAQSYAYRRIRSPPLRNSTPVHGQKGEDEGVREAMVGSQSPTPNKYNAAEDGTFGEQQRASRPNRYGRPATPYRRRGEGDDEQGGESDGENSFLGRLGQTLRRRSAGRDYSPAQQRPYYDSSRGGRPEYDSPARRSDVYSDLTMDDALVGRNRFPQSPAKTSEGIEVDMFKGRARPRSQSPSRYRDARYQDARYDDNIDRQIYRQPTRDYDTPRSREYYEIRELPKLVSDRRSPFEGRGAANRRSPFNVRGGSERDNRPRSRVEDGSRVTPRVHERSTPKVQDTVEQQREEEIVESSRSFKEIENKDRRHSSGEYVRDGKSSRSRRASEPLQPVNLRSRSQKSEEAIPEESKQQNDRKHRHEEQTQGDDDRNRDPTPRRSMEPQREDKKQERRDGPLPPTPRRRDGDRRSSRGAKEDFGHSEEQPRTTSRHSKNKEEKPSGDESRPHTAQRSHYDDNHHHQVKEKSHRSSSDGRRSRPQPLSSSKVESSTYEETYMKYKQPFSPSSVATDDEIRAEVSSVGMESSTLRPMNYYPNPFLEVPPPIMEEDNESGTHKLEAHSKEDSDAPSSLSKSTASTVEDAGRHSSGKKKVSSEKVPPATKESRKREKKGGNVPAGSTGSASTRSKKLWKGWKKAVGKVKAIVQDIDEHRIPPPQMGNLINLDPDQPSKGGKRSSSHHAKKHSSRE